MQKYPEQLRREAKYTVPAEVRHSIRTVYIGGGTPTLLPVPALEELLDFVASEMVGPETVEFSIEANPATLTEEVIVLLQRYGVNRVTLGLQSGQLQVLEGVGRAGGQDLVSVALARLRAEGIENIGIDFIVGLPGQTPAGIADDASFLAEKEVEHVSAYMLSVEPGTLLEQRVVAGELKLPSDARTRRMLQLFSGLLQKCGFDRYEVSNFAREKKYSIHNCLTREGAPYYGLGAGAVGCVDGVRYRNPAEVVQYLSLRKEEEFEACREKEILTRERRVEEAIMLGLRCSSGLDCTALSRREGYDLLFERERAIGQLISDGLLRRSGDRLFCTRKGWFWLDRVVMSLF